jgi:hypothetical protein
VALWDWFGTFAALAGRGDGTDRPCTGATSPCFDQRASSASLPPIDSYNVWPYISGQSAHSPRTELPLAAPNNQAGRPPNPWSGSQINVNGLIVTEADGSIWKLLTHEIPQSHWTGPHFPNRTSNTLGQTDIKGSGNTCGGTYTPGETFPGCGDGYTWCGNGCLFRLDLDPEERSDVASSNAARVTQMQSRIRTLASYVMSTGMNYNDQYLAAGGAGAAPVTTCTGDCGWQGEACHTALTKYQNFWGPFVDANSISGAGPFHCDSAHRCQVPPANPCPSDSLASSRCATARSTSVADCAACYRQYFPGCNQASAWCSAPPPALPPTIPPPTPPPGPSSGAGAGAGCPSSTWSVRAAEVEAACCPNDPVGGGGHRRHLLGGASSGSCTMPNSCQGHCPAAIVALHQECSALEASLGFMDNSRYTQLLAQCEDAVTGASSSTDVSHCSSVSDCATLGWPLDAAASDTVCAASERLSADYCSHGTYRQAAMICEGIHARMCTLEELHAGQASGTGCGLDTQNVWTSSTGTCQRGSHMVAAGASRGWADHGPACYTDDTILGVRCCADRDPYATTHCDSLCTSRLTCAQLGGNFRVGATQDVCAASEVPGCQTSNSWRHAAAVCAASGARLCTLVELEAGEAAGTGCGFDSQRTWTSTVSQCPQGQHMSAAGNTNSWATVPPECSDDSSDHKIRCCADTAVATVCEVPCTSSSSCGNLSWSTVGGVVSTDYICGAASPHCAIQSFTTAEATCLSLGARLCTVEEVASNEVRGTGCHFDEVPIWTTSSGACGSSRHITAAGDPRNWDAARRPNCTDDASLRAVRCCADEVPGVLNCAESANAAQNVCVSPTSCEALSWHLESTDDDICAESTALSCQQLNYVGAEAACLSVGARLCMLDEIGANEAAGTGCGFDSARIWTMDSDGCPVGQHISAAGKAFFWSTASPQCTDLSVVLGVRCCADAAASVRRVAGRPACA